LATLCLLACARQPAELYQSAKLLYKEGRFNEAAQIAERGYASYRGKPQSEWHWKFAILAAELELLTGHTSLADTYLAETPPASFAALRPRYEMLRGYSLLRHQQPVESKQLLTRAIADAQSLGDSETLTDAWLYLGASESNHGELGEADDALQKAQELAEKNGFDYQHAAAMLNRGFIQIKKERYGDAIPLLELARAQADKTGIKTIGQFALSNLATCYENLGDLDHALATLKTSIEDRKHSGLATSLSNDYSELGVIYQRKGDTAEAIRYFHLAFDIVTSEAPVEYALAAGNLANALQISGMVEEAEHFNQIALRYADPKDKGYAAKLLSTQAALAERRGQHQQAIEIYNKALNVGSEVPSATWQVYAGLAHVYVAAKDFKNASENYAKALAVIDSNRADQLKSDYKISFLANLLHFYQDYVELLIQHGDTDRALEIADSSRASVLTEDLLGKSETTRRALRPQLQKAAQASGSVFLFYWLAPSNSYLWLISAGQNKLIHLPDQQKIVQDTESYRDLIERQKRDPLLTASPAGAYLYQQLIGQVANLIPHNSHVVIVPDGVLHNLNFETLPVTSAQPHYWIEDATISIAPSLGILRAGKSIAGANRSLLLMGDPVTAGTPYEPLPQAALEISSIKQHFPNSTVLTGSHALMASYAAAQPAHFSLIHFATHVDANPESPLDSAIILSPSPNGYRLYARDVAQIPISADLVTISACRGAGARALSGEGLVGFAWAFFQAHASNVVTSLWDVFDTSTAELMNDFYAGIRAGKSYASALRDAKLKMLHANHQRPYYWAPFQLYSRMLD